MSPPTKTVEDYVFGRPGYKHRPGGRGRYENGKAGKRRCQSKSWQAGDVVESMSRSELIDVVLSRKTLLARHTGERFTKRTLSACSQDKLRELAKLVEKLAVDEDSDYCSGPEVTELEWDSDSHTDMEDEPDPKPRARAWSDDLVTFTDDEGAEQEEPDEAEQDDQEPPVEESSGAQNVDDNSAAEENQSESEKVRRM